MPVDFTRCRRITHRWDELPGPPLGFESNRRDAFWLRCETCLMVKAFEVSRSTGDVIWVRYWPQEGYYWKDKTVEAPTKQDYRLAWLRERLTAQEQPVRPEQRRSRGRAS